MMTLCFDVLTALRGKTLATAESCTGGGIGAALTDVPGSSAVYKGGIVSYCNEVKRDLLDVPANLLDRFGAVSGPVAIAMAEGARMKLETDIAVSVTGLAGPGDDEYGNPVGTVFVGYADENGSTVGEFHFEGDRSSVRRQAIIAALQLVLEKNTVQI